MPSPIPLQPNTYYHIYNRGNNRESLFHEERNYRYFLELYAQHVHPIADTFAYCLMKNHFHLLVRVKDLTGAGDTRDASQHFSNLFNAYARAFNRTCGRTGALFHRPFERIEVTSDRYFTNLVFYIHFNPQKHKFVDDFRDWPYSSYHALLSTKTTRVRREDVLAWFGGTDGLIQSHRLGLPESDIMRLIIEDFE
jgi:REP element-mobilizing transposase RayT